jgi:hypothetical protein
MALRVLLAVQHAHLDDCRHTISCPKIALRDHTRIFNRNQRRSVICRNSLRGGLERAGVRNECRGGCYRLVGEDE